MAISMRSDEPTPITDSASIAVEAGAPSPNLFVIHPNFSDEVNGNIVQSEVEGGVYLDELSEGSVVQVKTQHHCYIIMKCANGQALVSGHPEFCLEAVPVRIVGSTWGGSMLKLRFIGRGMRLEFLHPTYGSIRTSRVAGIEIVREPGGSRP
jgi:hypothetical protein